MFQIIASDAGIFYEQTHSHSDIDLSGRHPVGLCIRG
jgi:hypothetical protein